MNHRFKDRNEAGKKLVQPVYHFKGQNNVLVLALPRGGVPVGYEIAKALALPLDVWIVRKLGVPGHEEYAMGALAIGGIVHINRATADQLNISDRTINQVITRERTELNRRNKLYRHEKPTPDFKKKTVILVDDGLATGSTMKAAIESLRHQHAEKIIVAVPVGASDTVIELESIADEVICLDTPEPFFGVGAWYQDFSQTSDNEVRELLANQPWIEDV